MKCAAVFAVAIVGVMARLPGLGEAVRVRGLGGNAEKPEAMSFVQAGAKFGQEYSEVDVHAAEDGTMYFSINGAKAPSQGAEAQEQTPSEQSEA
ncbi:hypothetical protein TGRH88_014210 [Toxoplasma gondii]|uniref:Uncharacterized protein n=1 Tax=Toxoplasma gondii TaxID=5811 RepID=A0A7J6KBG6_TOXGO|nr:hypothetical protein TGRH88_014210 [Toxoplasma gondii]